MFFGEIQNFNTEITAMNISAIKFDIFSDSNNITRLDFSSQKFNQKHKINKKKLLNLVNNPQMLFPPCDPRKQYVHIRPHTVVYNINLN